MLKGHTFNLQTFTSEAFALFIDRFLNKKNGVAKGCTLSNTNTSVTIADGYFVVRGRFLQVISGVTISNISNNGYYSLVCEIDLTKTNTAQALNQAEIKTLFNANAYPTLTQEDITGSGTKFQYEFARFKVVNGAITDFTDKRTFVDFQSIYDEIISMVQQLTTNLTAETTALIAQIQENLDQVLDGSIYLLKTGGIVTGNLQVNGVIKGNTEVKTATVAYTETEAGHNGSVEATFRRSGNVVTVDFVFNNIDANHMFALVGADMHVPDFAKISNNSPDRGHIQGRGGDYIDYKLYVHNYSQTSNTSIIGFVSNANQYSAQDTFKISLTYIVD